MTRDIQTAAQKPRQPLIIGWRELIDLPDLALIDLPAKIDTGARTSALHAAKLTTFTRDGVLWARFALPHPASEQDVFHEAPVQDQRDIKNTSGVPETRLIIRTAFAIAGRRWKIDLSLADRGNMQFPLIVGRSALADHHIAVDTGRSYLTRRRAPKKKKKIRFQPERTEE